MGFAVTELSYLIRKLLRILFSLILLFGRRLCLTGLSGGWEIETRVCAGIVASVLLSVIDLSPKILGESSLVPNLELGLLYVHLLI